MERAGFDPERFAARLSGSRAGQDEARDESDEQHSAQAPEHRL